jgi:chaperonin GroES
MAKNSVLSKYKPYGDRVLVRRDEMTEKTAGGIYIPEVARQKEQSGEVIAVGPGRKNDKGEMVIPAVTPGDKVLFGKYSGTEVPIPIEIDGADYLLIREDEILIVLQK